MTELLDSNTYGTKHQFTFSPESLTIRKKSLFKSEVVAVIPISNIISIKYVKPEVQLSRIIIHFLLSPFYLLIGAGPDIDGPYLEITYKIGSEEAIGGYSSRITEMDLQDMKSIVENYS